MCIPNRQLEPKSRRLTILANICLVVGLVLWEFVHPGGQVLKDWRDAVCGFLLGLSVTIQLHRLWIARRCRQKQI